MISLGKLYDETFKLGCKTLEIMNLKKSGKLSLKIGLTTQVENLITGSNVKFHSTYNFQGNILRFHRYQFPKVTPGGIAKLVML